MRPALTAAVAAAGLVLAAGSASAQGLTYKPIDTSKYLVQPTDQATGFLANAARTLSRAAANSIDASGYTKTVNNLFGSNAQQPTTQAGYSPLPLPSLYPSTRYKSQIQPVMPTSSRVR